MSWAEGSWADDAIDSLAALPGFPPSAEKAARETLARRLETILRAPESTSTTNFHPPGCACGNCDQGRSPVMVSTTRLVAEEQAIRWAHELVAVMLDYDRWPGPGHFFSVARKLRYGSGDYDSRDVPHLSQYLPPAKLAGELCPACQSFGYVVQDGVYARCHHCPDGKDLSDTFLDMLNGRTKQARGARELRPLDVATVARLGTPAARKLVTITDIEDALHVRRVERALNDPEFATGGKLPDAGN
jgi:hypothetical protein